MQLQLETSNYYCRPTGSDQ